MAVPILLFSQAKERNAWHEEAQKVQKEERAEGRFLGRMGSDARGLAWTAPARRLADSLNRLEIASNSGATVVFIDLSAR